ncbi:MAG: hypothetical protein EF807_02270 [Candidatus Methanolliviera hydrocarbonicum]|uniref:Uncharacterized protein n=1 Tax=Candidatus Methanolliviera hydrocarbonicum TaxID=2491085 RepID=A0A520KXX0_9EURY|nr:MAG: hypothetical protein EF807_02270 [Candidatus Methanolliviera hydrocarbonicum]
MGLVGESKGISDYKHIVLLSQKTPSVTTNVDCRWGDKITVDIERLDDEKGPSWLYIYDPFGREWETLEIREGNREICRSFKIPSDGNYKMSLTTNRNAHGSTIVYTIFRQPKRGNMYMRPIDIKFPGSADLR